MAKFKRLDLSLDESYLSSSSTFYRPYSDIPLTCDGCQNLTAPIDSSKGLVGYCSVNGFVPDGQTCRQYYSISCTGLSFTLKWR